ncbi:MAG: HPr-rel-A system PqqD family peptide chaperone [Magnetococcales bacterium]|nr:HPr-rel-A system PqqD family peptide chaperone [Magnetococcales bacterium]
MNISQETQWFVPDRCSLIWEQFNNGCLIFNPLSGATHLLFDPVLDILKLFEENPMTANTIINSLDLAIEDEEQKKEIMARVWQIILDLDHLGIIQPVELNTSKQTSISTS